MDPIDFMTGLLIIGAIVICFVFIYNVDKSYWAGVNRGYEDGYTDGYNDCLDTQSTNAHRDNNVIDIKGMHHCA